MAGKAEEVEDVFIIHEVARQFASFLEMLTQEGVQLLLTDLKVGLTEERKESLRGEARILAKYLGEVAVSPAHGPSVLTPLHMDGVGHILSGWKTEQNVEPARGFAVDYLERVDLGGEELVSVPGRELSGGEEEESGGV